MNFFSHAVIAAGRSHDPSFVLGAMLPDLLGMVGLRLAEAHDPELKRGIDLHHATDSAFHAAPSFTQLCAEAIAQLTGERVERGTARAVGHVGVELLLDGALSGDGDVRSLYAAALGLAADGGLEGRLSLAQPGALERLASGLGRLAAAPLPEAYREPGIVADRLRVILGTRPRLAMQPRDLEPVRSWLEAVCPVVVDRRHELLEQVRRAL